MKQNATTSRLRPPSFVEMLPILTIAVGVVILLFSYWDHRQEIKDTHKLFEAHVDSVARLVKEGAREASASTSLIYDLFEENLFTAASLLAQSPSPLVSDAILVNVTQTEEGAVGDFGPIPREMRAPFLEWMSGGSAEVLVDDGPVASLGLACILHELSRDRSSIVCGDAELLSVLRQEIGIGPLLKDIAKEDVLYVALQDQSGILAISPPDAAISTWQNDPSHASALASSTPAGVSRFKNDNRRFVFEGLIPFPMADGTTVLLRVGIDGTPFKRVQTSSKNRFSMMLTLVLSLVVFSFLVVWLIRRWQHKQRELNALIEEKEQKRRHWETIGQMAATVAHEVRNPLNTIGMVSQRLKKEFSIDENERPEFDEMLDIMSAESVRVGRFITEFLDLGKPLALQPSRFLLPESLNEALLPLLMRAETENKSIAITSEEAVEVTLDRDRFRQIVINLVGNALDAVSPGGRVNVEAVADSTQLTLTVADDGPGLTDAQMSEVLKPFVSFKSTGTGLGLPLVNRIAEAHGGTFSLSATPDSGTTATVRIPIAQEDRPS